MAGAFDDLIPGAPGAAPAAAADGGGNAFAGLIPAGQSGGSTISGSRPLTITGGDSSAAVGRGLVDGVPVLGPYMLGGLNRVAAGVRSLEHGTPFSDELGQVERFGQDTAENHPTATFAGNMGGAALGAAAFMPAEALGAGAVAGSPGLAAAFGAGGGATLGAADAYTRGQDPAAGALMGGVFGGVGPAIGNAVGAGARYVAGALRPVPEALQAAGSTGRRWLMNGLGDATAQDIAAAQHGVGPSGFSGEATPGLLDLSGSIADNNGPGKATVRDAYKDRMDATAPRVQATIANTLGPHDMTAQQYQDHALNVVGRLGRQRDQMLGAAPPVDISGAAQATENAIPRWAEHSGPRQYLVDALRRLHETNPEAGQPTPGTWEPDFSPVEPQGAPPPAPPPHAVDEVPLDDDTETYARPQTPSSRRPQSAVDVILQHGGIQDKGGDLASMGLHNLIAKPDKGLGADAMRQVLAELGYFGGHNAHDMHVTDENDLWNLLSSDRPAYSADDMHSVLDWQNYDEAREAFNRGGKETRSRDVGMGGNRAAPPDAFDPGPPVDPNAPPPPPVPAQRLVSDPRQIHGLKQEFDTEINYDGRNAPSNPVMRAKENGAGTIRDELNRALREAVPEYGPNQDAQSALLRARDQVDLGREDIATSPNPVDFRETVARLEPLELGGRQVGQREAVHAKLGRSGNDFVALKNALQGTVPSDGALIEPNGAGWALQNLGTLFGDDAAEGLNTGLNQEAQMRANTQRVTGGSPTGEKIQRSQLTTPEGQTGPVAGAANYAENLMIDKPLAILKPQQIYKWATNKAFEGARARTAPYLVRQGDEAQQLLDALMQLREQRANLAPVGRDTAKLVTAIMGLSAPGVRQQLQAQ